MTRLRSFVRTSARFAAIVGLTTTAHAQSSFLGLGDLPGGAYESAATAVARDGKAVVGTATTAAGATLFRWTEMDGMVPLGTLLNGHPFQTAGVSANGRFVVGGVQSAGGVEAFRWTAAGGASLLGDLAGGAAFAGANCVSADGTIAAGIADAYLDFPPTGQAFRWTQATGLVGLGWLEAGNNFSSCSAMSDDGSVIVGQSGLSSGNIHYQAFKWTEAAGMVGLGYLQRPDAITYSGAAGVSPDGGVIVGDAHFMQADTEYSEAVYWDQDGQLVVLGDLPGGDHYAVALASSAHGKVIVGLADGVEPKAFIWDAANGMRDLKGVLETDFGLDLTGWTLEYATGISADATVIVGSGLNPAGDREAWIARIANPACVADIVPNGVIDQSDLGALLSVFGETCP